MRLRRDCRRGNVAFAMVLQPIPLIKTVVASVRCVNDVKLDEESSILKTCRSKGHRFLQGNSYETPLAIFGVGSSMGDEEESVSAANNGGNKLLNGWDDRWSQSRWAGWWSLIHDLA